MKLLKYIFILTFFVTISSCKKDKTVSPLIIDENIGGEDVVSTIYFIRHAEKDRSDSSNRDPELTQEGLGRAVFWAEVFNKIQLDAVYSTEYERTKMTAAPTAIQQEISVQYYNPSTLAADAPQFLADNLGKKVLVVGHSNTTPDFVNKVLGEEKYSQMDENNNSSLFVVTIIGNQASANEFNFDITVQ